MCGLFGVYNFKINAPVSKVCLERGINILKHRGPDDQGFYTEENIGLAHCRLSIIDIEGGRQPISNEDKTIWVVFNGEIYNYKELRESLTRNGHRFNTRTDTETIIHLYEDFGEKCLDKLNGIFAFALYDKKNKKLILARDRLGVKPIFYYYTNNGVVFSSEIKSFLTLESFYKEINPEALKDYFSLGYILNPKTIFKNVYNLSPGYYLEISDGKSILNQYWDINLFNGGQNTIKNLIMSINEKISTSVRMQMISDVPIGAFSSGGLDSSTVLYYMKGLLANNDLITFSAGFNEKTYDELGYVRLVNKYLDVNNKEIVVNAPDIECIKRIAWHNDEPFADTSCIPMYFVSDLASKYVKVVLSGDGGDENFGGYETYIADIIAKTYKNNCPKILRKLFEQIVFCLPITFNKVSLDYKLRRFTEGAEFDSLKAHYWWRLFFTPEEQKRLFSQKLFNSTADYDPLDVFRRYYDKTDGLPILQRLSYVDYKTWLTDDILRKVDRCSMAHSLEARVPLLDHRLVEFSANIHDKFKLRYGITKYIFKKCMQNKLPEKVIWRKKSGFNSPVSHWIKKELRGVTQEYLNVERLSETGLFQPEFIEDLKMRHMEHKEDNGLKIWCLLNFMLWYEFAIEDNAKLF